MKKENIIAIFMLSFLIISCDNRKDVFKKELSTSRLTLKLNNQKTVEVESERTVDSAKISKPYRLSFTFEQKNKIQVLLTLSDPSGLILWKKEGGYSGSVDFVPESLGEYRLAFSTSDVYGQTHMQYVAIESFSNLPPVAVLKTTVNGRQLTMDATESHDMDAVYGGGIVEYLFIVTDEEGVSKHYSQGAVVNVTLNQGNYNVYLKVRDNEKGGGEWSEEVSTKITIRN